MAGFQVLIGFAQTNPSERSGDLGARIGVPDAMHIWPVGIDVYLASDSGIQRPETLAYRLSKQ